VKKIRVGLIGCGIIGSFWAKVLSQLEEVRIIGVCDVDLEKTRSLSSKLGVKSFAHHQDLLQIHEIEAVLVVTPNYTHCAITLEASQAKKHVYCEKPMALSVDDCGRMIRACEKNEIKLAIGQNGRFLSIFAKIKEILDSGILGEPVSISISRFWDYWDYTPWRSKKNLCGPLLFEFDIHELDLMRYLCGDVKAVFAMMGNSSSVEVDYQDIAFVLFHFASGAVGSLHSNLASRIGEFEGKIQGEKGTLFFDFPRQLIKYKTVSGQSKEIELGELSLEESYKQSFRHFAESIWEDKTPIVSGGEGRAAIELAEAAYVSAERKSLVRLPLN